MELLISCAFVIDIMRVLVLVRDRLVLGPVVVGHILCILFLVLLEDSSINFVTCWNIGIRIVVGCMR